MCIHDHQAEGCTPPAQQPDVSGAYESQAHPQASRKDDDKTGTTRRSKVDKLARAMGVGHESKGERSTEDVDWNEFAGMFQVTARKPQ
jgi:hypothetical protein